MAFRATECKANVPGRINYQLIGSVCFYILGCAEYTTGFDTPYRCSKCYDGFYLNDK